MSNLILYPKGERAFDTNGIGILSDALDATVTEELNGQFELEVQYPLDGIHFEAIANEAIITSEIYPGSGHKPFDIYRIKKTSKSAVTIWARTPAYRCRKIVVSPFSASSAPAALQGLKINAVNDCPFEFWTDITAAEMKVAVPTDIWKLLGSSDGCVLNIYGGEYEFDGFNIKLHNRRGANRGVSIRYGKNLTSLVQDENCANCYTAVYPYWNDADGNLTQLPEKLVRAPGDHDDIKVLPLDLSKEFDAKPTAEQLRERAEKYIVDNDIGKPAVSWTVEFVQLEQTEEYKGKAILERVFLGDTVSVVFPQMGVDVSARAVARKYKPLLGRHQSITLGSVKKTIADTIVNQEQAIKDVPSRTLVQQIAAQLLTTILGAKGGAVRHLDTDGDGWPDTLYIADNPDPALAVKIWRWNYEGWAASKTGYNGPFVMGATLEDGLLASAVTAANIIAGFIKSKDGSTLIDLDNSFIQTSGNLLLSGGTSTTKMSKGGLSVFVSDADNTRRGTLSLSVFESRNNNTGETSYSFQFGSSLPVQLHGGPLSIGASNDRVVIKSLLAEWEKREDGKYTLVGVPIFAD